MYNKIILLFLFCLLGLITFGQQKWSLRQCVQYALDSNISVKQKEIQAQLAGITYKQSKLSQIPIANFSNSEGYRFGKSQNPSTGILENQNFFQVGLNLQTSVTIFNWYAKKNTILANEWSTRLNSSHRCISYAVF